MSYSQSANAQEISLDPEFGSVSLRAGFEPDPHTVQFPAGGYFNLRPDYRLSYTPGQFLPLRIFVESDVDTTLIVNDPAGDLHCDDDSGPGVIRRSNNRGMVQISAEIQLGSSGSPAWTKAVT